MKLSEFENPNARLYIEIEGDRLNKYTKEFNNGGSFINVEEFSRYGKNGQPRFFHQTNSKLSTKTKFASEDNYDFHEAKSFREVVAAIIDDMHLDNHNYGEINLKIDGKYFTTKTLSDEEKAKGNVFITIDQAKEIIKQVLLDKVCVKTLEDGTKQRREFVKDLNFNFGPDVYRSPESIVTQAVVTHDLLKESGVNITTL